VQASSSLRAPTAGSGSIQSLAELGVGFLPLLRLLTHPAVLDDPQPDIPNTLLAVAYENMDLAQIAAALEAAVPAGATSSSNLPTGPKLAAQLLNAAKVGPVIVLFGGYQLLSTPAVQSANQCIQHVTAVHCKRTSAHLSNGEVHITVM
jgi:hypothetical protein